MDREWINNLLFLSQNARPDTTRVGRDVVINANDKTPLLALELVNAVAADKVDGTCYIDSERLAVTIDPIGDAAGPAIDALHSHLLRNDPHGIESIRAMEGRVEVLFESGVSIVESVEDASDWSSWSLAINRCVLEQYDAYMPY